MTYPPALAILVGIPGCGKSTYIHDQTQPHKGHNEFESWSVFSTDVIREKLTGNISSQDVNDTVFATLYEGVKKHLSSGWCVVVDATNLTPQLRGKLLTIALDCVAIPYAYRFGKSTDLTFCQQRNLSRHDRFEPVPEAVMVRFHGLFLQQCRPIDLESEGWRVVEVKE